MKKHNPNYIKYQYHLLKFEESQSPEHAIQIAQMILGGQLRVSVNDGQLAFFAKSQYKNKCIRCQTYYLKGDPCFCQDGRGWHITCATDDEKRHEKFVNYIKFQNIGESK